MVHALLLPEGDEYIFHKKKKVHFKCESKTFIRNAKIRSGASVTYQGFKRARASANLLFRKSSRAVEHSFNAVSKSILDDLNERSAN